jgi:tellurite methyltransferase
MTEFKEYMMDKFTKARAVEIDYHERFYQETVLFESGTWLSKPVKVILECLELFNLRGMQVLDLGSGVGRNSIPIAQRLKAGNGKVTCIDLIPSAIEKLLKYAEQYEVKDEIVAEISDVEFYGIKQSYYDYIIACSSLEHVSSEDAFCRVIERIIQGTKADGINSILINTEVEEFNLDTRELTEGVIELNMKTEHAITLLQELYEGWHILVLTQAPQKNLEYKDGKEIEFRSKWVTFVARNS